MAIMYSGDEQYGDDITSGIDHQDEPYEGELDQNDFERELEDAEDGL